MALSVGNGEAFRSLELQTGHYLDGYRVEILEMGA
jgi:hypothetical protein